MSLRRNQNFELGRESDLFLLFFSFAAVVDLVLGLLPVKETAKKASSRRAICAMEQPGPGCSSPGLARILFSVLKFFGEVFCLYCFPFSFKL